MLCHVINSCPLPLFIVNRLSNNEDMTGSPLQGTQNQASIGGGIGFKIDIQLNVYYTSTVNQMASDCVGDKISVAGKMSCGNTAVAIN